jgi:hypothetical protein
VESADATNKPTYRCIVYSETTGSASGIADQQPHKKSQQDQYRQTRHKFNNLDSQHSDFIDLSNANTMNLNNNQDNIELFEKSNLQIFVSHDEFCRNVDTILDEQFSFTFSKGIGMNEKKT